MPVVAAKIVFAKRNAARREIAPGEVPWTSWEEGSYILRRRCNVNREDEKTKKESGPTSDKKKPAELSDLALVLPARSLDSRELSSDDLSVVAGGGPAGPTPDDPRYSTLLQELLAKIPATTPDWTASGGSPGSPIIRRRRPQ
jgi:hypothetical protein